jgi:hypothetical protein
MGRLMRCAMADAWGCDHKFDAKSGGKVLYIPYSGETTKVCRSCYQKLLRKKFIKKVDGITLGKWV